MSRDLVISRKRVIDPKPGSPWAEEMVLNPAILEDPRTGRIHMLFRATGPWPEKKRPNRPLPYPIFLGYAYSEDRGETWHVDFSRPALAPRMEEEVERLYIRNRDGERVVNYANGCIEDPRLFWLEGQCYLTVACRMFAPGPYWVHDEPTQCAPDWIRTSQNPFGRAAAENVTVNVLYQVDLEALAHAQYETAFAYVTHLTDPEFGEDRDVFLFPERLNVHGKKQVVSIHRPKEPGAYPTIPAGTPPAILLCAAPTVYELWDEQATQTLLAAPRFPWEKDRVGASAPPLRISDREWLLCYHGKQDDTVGYTQSFMVLEEQGRGLPVVTHRCPERIMTAQADWEQPHKFKTPCVFITGLIRMRDTLMVSYGAADEKVGVAWLDYPGLIERVKQYDAEGKST